MYNKIMAASERKHKNFETDRQGRISVSPALCAQKEKGKLKLILKRLIQLLQTAKRALTW